MCLVITLFLINNLKFLFLTPELNVQKRSLVVAGFTQSPFDPQNRIPLEFEPPRTTIIMGLPQTVEFARKFAVMVKIQGPVSITACSAFAPLLAGLLLITQI